MATRQLVEPPDKLKKSASCVHCWVIEAASGPTSMGKCRFCRETREFVNFIELPEEEDRPWSSFGSLINHKVY